MMLHVRSQYRDAACDALTCTDAHAERIAELEALFAEGLAS